MNFYEAQIEGGEYFTLPTRYQDPTYIGNGSYGVVVSAFDTQNMEKVAIKKIKCIDPAMGKYWFRELTLLKYSNHRHTVSLLDVFTPAESGDKMEEFYIVMEFMEKTLQDVMFSTHVQVALFFYQLLIALKELHHGNIIHRDLKPINIGIRQDYTLKLLDFGMAREKSADNSQMTSGVQTLIYRAPEIILNTSYDTKVDVWSLGCTFAEMLTGERLFKEKDEFHQLTEIMRVTGTPSADFISKLPTNTQKIFKQCEGMKMENVIPDSSIRMEDSNQEINELARDLLSKLLQFNPEDRISIDEALKHKYFDLTMTRYTYEGLEDEIFGGVELEFPNSPLTNEHVDCPLRLKDWREKIFQEIVNL